MNIRVAIAKHDVIAAAYIRQAADEAGLIGEFILRRTAESALQTLRAHPADLALVGLTFSDIDGLDLIRTVIRERLAFRILVISSRHDELVRAQLRPGRINGFFHSEMDDAARLPEAIRRVAAGETYFSPNVTARLAGQTVDRMFTPHQIRVFAALCSAGNEEEAAAELGLSVHTLHGHAQRIRRKLGVQKLSQLIIEAIRRGVVRVTPEEILRPGV